MAKHIHYQVHVTIRKMWLILSSINHIPLLIFLYANVISVKYRELVLVDY